MQTTMHSTEATGMAKATRAPALRTALYTSDWFAAVTLGLRCAKREQNPVIGNRPPGP